MVREGGSDRVVWQVRMCYYKKQQDMYACKCGCLWYIVFACMKRAALFFSPTFARARPYMTEHSWKAWRRGKKRFTYMKNFHLHIHTIKTRTQRRVVWMEGKRERHESISHSINTWMYMLFLCSRYYFVFGISVCAPVFFPRHIFREGEKAAAAATKSKENKTIKEIYRASFLFFTCLAARRMRMWKNTCVYCLLAVYCFFPFRIAGALF